MLVVDLDNFKRINDSLGHRSGDLALQQAAQRIRAVLGQHDMLARFSGDEFCVLTLGAWEHAQATAERILDQLRPPFVLGDTQLRLTASIGISQYPRTASTSMPCSVTPAWPSGSARPAAATAACASIRHWNCAPRRTCRWSRTCAER